LLALEATRNDAAIELAAVSRKAPNATGVRAVDGKERRFKVKRDYGEQFNIFVSDATVCPRCCEKTSAPLAY
jgi:hypothetical protein